MDCQISSSDYLHSYSLLPGADLLSQILNSHPHITKTNTKTTTKIQPRHRHILATPLVDVLSVSIHKRSRPAHWSPKCEIYGHIRVINTRPGGNAEALSLFHRDENNPHHTNVGMPLPLNLSSPILPSKYTKLDMLLYDRNANKMVVAEGRIVLDIKSDACEEDHVESVFGHKKLAMACVHYSVFQYAVAATVDVLFFSKDDNFDLLTKNDNEDDAENDRKLGYDTVDVINYDRRKREDGAVADVFGSVSVFSTVTNGKSKQHTRQISLFSKSPEQAVLVKSGDFIQLSRSLVTVPAYSSSLVVEVKLSLGNTGEPLPSGILEFHPEDSSTFKKDLDGEHGRVRVRVTWNNAYDQQLYHEKRQECQDVKPRCDPDLVEVFSVAVHSKDSRDFSFYGTVDVNNMKEFCMYSKDKSCPQVCPQAGALLPLKGPWFGSLNTVDEFSLRVHLKDGTTGGEFSDGYAAWDSRMISFWNDRRLCSVIQGELGFAAVHYTAFRDATPAVVNIKLYGEQLPGYVYGKIVAGYSTYEYETAYDKKYFQNILFDRHSEDDGLQAALGCGSDVPLLKSVVCLPDDATLVVEFDLAVASQPSFDGNLPQGATLLQGCLELTPDECLQQLYAETFHIDVSLSSLPWHARYAYEPRVHYIHMP